jgi:glycosyltransferase involved in cell wall biosynthesis
VTLPTIAHVLSSFGMGGQERVALDLARVQVKQGHRVLAISLAPPPDGPLAEEFRAAGVVVVTVPKGKGVDPTLVVRLRSLLRAAGVQLVHTHNPQPLIYAAPAARLAGARVVHSKHGINPDKGRKLLLRRAAARLADRYVAVSALTAEASRAAHEVSEKKLRVVDNGVDLTRFGDDPAARHQVRGELGLAEQAILVGTVGRLSAEKNQGLLIDAIAAELGAELQLVLVGSGSEEAALRARAAASPFIHFMGLRRDVPRVLAGLDLFVLSSLNDGLPLVIPEAMAMRLPVVATRVGGVPGVVIDGVTGLLTGSGDVAGLHDAIMRLAGDAGLRWKLGERGREVALERYSAERMAADYHRIYQEALAAGRRGVRA